MSVSVNAELLNVEVQQILARMRKKFPFVAKRVVMRAATAARTEVTQLIGKDTGLPAKRIKEALQLVVVGDFRVDLVARGKRIPLIDFGARGPEPSRGKGSGVSYRLPGGRGRDPNAFIATMPNGHRGVYKRSEKSRTPIMQLHGPSLVRVFEKYTPAAAEVAREALYRNLRSEISYALSK